MHSGKRHRAASPLWTEWHTPVKTLPSPLRYAVRSVKIEKWWGKNIKDITFFAYWKIGIPRSWTSAMCSFRSFQFESRVTCECNYSANCVGSFVWLFVVCITSILWMLDLFLAVYFFCKTYLYNLTYFLHVTIKSWLYSFEFFHNSRLIRRIQQTKICKKFTDLTRDRIRVACLTVRHRNHYTRMFSVLVWSRYRILITSFGRNYTYIETLWKEVKWSMKWPYSMQLNQLRNVLFQTHLFSIGSSGRVGGGAKKHEIYVAAFGGHLFYD